MDLEIQNMKALKLDSSYRPIEIIDAIEALVMCLVGKAIAVEKYTHHIRTPSTTFELPAVVVLRRIVRFRFYEVLCNRENVIWRDDHTCQYCGKEFPFVELTLDHVIPSSRGGTNEWDNLVASCKKCNQRKGNRTPQESHMFPINKPYKPRPNILRSVKKSQISDLWKNYLWDTG